MADYVMDIQLRFSRHFYGSHNKAAPELIPTEYAAVAAVERLLQDSGYTIQGIGRGSRRVDSLEPPEHYRIDFSGTQRGLGWYWRFNIPIGGSAYSCDVLRRVQALQQSYGCANVTSGNAVPVTPGLIGIYTNVRAPVRHRIGRLCRCDLPLPEYPNGC